MGKPDTRRLDREIRKANRKLAAVRERELWPLDSPERRAVMRAAASGGYRLHRGESTGRAENAMDTAWQAAETRLTAEITALQTERQRIVTETARDKAAKKSSGWF
ncbi:hypothetical protein LMJ38_11910 [Streptomyces sp. R1]|uniref:hypothetical protein n=1 Tax=Streptomyces sp. R1 TaxID=1509279 RepID=UPI001E4BDDA7|nr:hypothetical protein [Streptomyces sp. R1]MCC8336635.1 hypothetical protein [Streptomyces sp. R1]